MYIEKTESYPCDVAIGDIGFLEGLGKHTFVKNISWAKNSNKVKNKHK